MLESITLKGFQVHEDRTINFDPSLTCITGKNDAGKSAILRALYWVCFNKPSGESFKHWDKAKVSVKLKVDGHTIIRKKGKENVYILDGKKYKAFGTGVPEDIQKVLNMAGVNFQHQKEAPFWLSLSPAQVSKELNKIVDLEVIDTSLANVAAGLRKAKMKAEVTEDRLKEARKRKKELLWVTEAEKDLRKIERTHDKLREVTTQCVKLRAYLSDVSKLKQQAKSLAKLATEAQKVQKIADNLEKINRRREKLSNIISDYDERKKESWELKNELKRVKEKIEKVKVCPVCQQPMNQ